MTGADAVRTLAEGCDFVLVGRAAILRYDFPARVVADPGFVSPPLPVTPEYLVHEGVRRAFVAYLRSFSDFLAPAD